MKKFTKLQGAHHCCRQSILPLSWLNPWKKTITDNTAVLIGCPVDYYENMKLTKKLGKLVCSI